jgi:hypothetical protein
MERTENDGICWEDCEVGVQFLFRSVIVYLFEK